MKKIVYILVFLFLYCSIDSTQVISQQGEEYRSQKRIDELARIKLIEALQLDEEKSVRFFSRRNEHKNKMENLNFKKEILLDNIEKKIADAAFTANAKEYTKLIQDYLKIESDIDNERKAFLQSLNEILTEQEICKFIVFERNFKRELKDLLMQHRKMKRK